MQRLLRLFLAFGFVAFLFSFSSTASAALFDLGDAGDFALLAVRDGDDPKAGLSSTARVIGDIGVAETNLSGALHHGSYDLSASSAHIGTAYLEAGVKVLVSAGATSGSINQPFDLTQAVLDAYAASAAIDALAATQTFGTINNDLTITGNGGYNIIDVTDLLLSSTEVLTLSGGPSDFFIFNISDDMDFNGSSKVALTGGVPTKHILFNFPIDGTDANVSLDEGIQFGTFLAPQRSLSWHGHNNDYTGAMIANVILLESGTGTFTFERFGDEPPQQGGVIPEPSSLLLLGLGLVGARIGSRRPRKV